MNTQIPTFHCPLCRQEYDVAVFSYIVPELPYDREKTTYEVRMECRACNALVHLTKLEGSKQEGKSE